MDDFPRTIPGLRHCLPDPIAVNPRTIWQPFEAFLLEHGYQLWKACSHGATCPPDDREEVPTGFKMFSSFTPGASRPTPSFAHSRPTICPARTRDGRDVMIRIVAIGNSGIGHKTALERVSTGNMASVIGNHAVPVLEWLSFRDITFAVFPFLGTTPPCLAYAFENSKDLLNTMVQLLEAVEFCHARLVAHRDLFEGNFLSNYASSSPYPDSRSDQLDRPPKPFRSTFPFKLFLNDFEFAVCFDLGSDPQTHRSVGKPIPDSEGMYARPVAPELETQEPYSPFCLDMWQLAQYFCILPIYGLPSQFQDLIATMMHVDPSERPTARRALDTLRNLISNLNETELNALTVEDYIQDDDIGVA